MISRAEFEHFVISTGVLSQKDPIFETLLTTIFEAAVRKKTAFHDELGKPEFMECLIRLANHRLQQERIKTNQEEVKTGLGRAFREMLEMYILPKFEGKFSDPQLDEVMHDRSMLATLACNQDPLMVTCAFLFF